MTIDDKKRRDEIQHLIPFNMHHYKDILEMGGIDGVHLLEHLGEVFGNHHTPRNLSSFVSLLHFFFLLLCFNCSHIHLLS
jgi:hypothetical protein